MTKGTLIFFSEAKASRGEVRTHSIQSSSSGLSLFSFIRFIDFGWSFSAGSWPVFCTLSSALKSERGDPKANNNT